MIERRRCVGTGWVVAVVACASWACGGASGPSRVPTGEYPVAAASVAIVEFDLTGATVRYNEPTEAFGLAIAEQIAGALLEKGIEADVAPAGQTAAADLVVSGRITRIDAGSRSQRYWVGFGAGSAKFGVVGTVRESDGKKVATFSHERWSGFGVFGGNSASLVQKCLRAVGRDVAKMIETGSYTGVSD